MEQALRSYLFGPRVSRGTIAMFLAIGIGLVGFGNADRILWALTSSGGNLPGIVLETRSFRTADKAQLAYIPKVAFRDPAGQIQIREADSAALPFDLSRDQPVRVLWDEARDQIKVDVAFERHRATSVVLTLVSAVGLTAWVAACWLAARRILLAARRAR